AEVHAHVDRSVLERSVVRWLGEHDPRRRGVEARAARARAADGEGDGLAAHTWLAAPRIITVRRTARSRQRGSQQTALLHGARGTARSASSVRLVARPGAPGQLGSTCRSARRVRLARFALKLAADAGSRMGPRPLRLWLGRLHRRTQAAERVLRVARGDVTR